jgi:DHA2 family multidrug resistance protein
MTKIFIFDPPYLRRASGRVDAWGIGMLAVGMACLQIMLDKGQQEDWFSSNWITALAVLSAVALLTFVIYELKAADPVLHLRVFKERTYATGVFLMTVLGFVLYGSLVLLPLFLQTVLGYPAIEAGIAMAPRGLGSFIAMPIVGLLTAKVDPRKLLSVGLIGGAVTLFQLGSLNLQVGYWDIFWPQFFQGISMGLIFVPLTTVTMSLIAREEMGNATSLFNLMRNLGGSIGIATIATMLSRNSQAQYNILGGHVSASTCRQEYCWSRSAQDLRPEEWIWPRLRVRRMRRSRGMVSQQAVMVAFVQLFRILAPRFCGCDSAGLYHEEAERRSTSRGRSLIDVCLCAYIRRDGNPNCHFLSFHQRHGYCQHAAILVDTDCFPRPLPE